MKLSIVIPVFNERTTIGKILEEVRRIEFEKEILLVDDGSSDGTREFLESLRQEKDLQIFTHDRNRGKGAALRTGFEHVTGDIVITQDADLEYDPRDYHKLILPILEGKADVVYGSRFLGETRRVFHFWNMVGNKILTFLSNMCTNLNLTDLETGYKVFRREVIENLRIRADGFSVEAEITAKIARMKYRIYEVPISYYGRDYFEGKKIGWFDGIRAAGTILKYTFIDDEEGRNIPYQTLNRMEHVRRYNSWIFQRIRTYIGERVMEVGAGVGNMTKFLVRRAKVIATDSEEKYLTILRNLFDGYGNVKVQPFVIGKDDPGKFAGKSIDSILCLNVLEHVEDDEEALRTFHRILSPGGRVILLVPSLKILYGVLDKNLGHFRRYSRRELVQKMERAGFQSETHFYFNLLGSLGWFVNSRILRRKILPRNQLRLFNLLVPLLKVEGKIRIPFGMSLVLVAKKSAQLPPGEEGSG